MICKVIGEVYRVIKCDDSESFKLIETTLKTGVIIYTIRIKDQGYRVELECYDLDSAEKLFETLKACVC